MAAFWEHHHEWVEVSEPFAVVPTPYIVAPILGAGPHKEGDPVGLYITPPHSITGPGTSGYVSARCLLNFTLLQMMLLHAFASVVYSSCLTCCVRYFT